MTEETPLERARLAGNALVGEQKYELAIGAYTSGLDDPASADDPRRHLVLGNRALCYTELGRFEEAVLDAQEAVTQNPAYTKGWFRIVVASVAAKKPAKTILRATKKVLELDPTHAEALSIRDSLSTNRFFTVPEKTVRERDRVFSKHIQSIRKCTDMKKNEKDPYGNGDQSAVKGEMPGQPAFLLRHAWGDGADFGASNFVSPFMKYCIEGNLKKVEEIFTMIEDEFEFEQEEKDQARPSLEEKFSQIVNKRESLLRLCSLNGVIAGARMLPSPDTFRPDPECNHVELAKLLIKKGVNIHSKDIAGYSIVHHCCTVYGNVLSLKILLLLHERDPNLDVMVENRFGCFPHQEPLMRNKSEIIKTLMMFPSLNLHKADRSGVNLLQTPAGGMTFPDAAAMIRKCTPGAGIRIGEMGELYGLKTATHLNGLLAKVVGFAAPGKYMIEIVATADDNNNNNNSKAQKEQQQQSTAAASAAAPTTDVQVKKVAVSIECIKKLDGTWFEDEEEARVRKEQHQQRQEGSSKSLKHETTWTVCTEPESMKGQHMAMAGAQGPKGAKKPKKGERFLIKVQVPMIPAGAPESVAHMAANQWCVIYDASQTYQFRMSGADEPRCYPELAAAVRACPDYGGCKAFFWATADDSKKSMTIEKKVAPPQPW